MFVSGIGLHPRSSGTSLLAVLLLASSGCGARIGDGGGARCMGSMVPSAGCVCGGERRTSGYCCSDAWQSTACGGGQCGAPTLSPSGGVFSSPVTVAITCPTSGSLPCYTTNGSTPTTASTQGSTVSLAASTVLQAICAGGGCSASAVASGAYVISTATAGNWVRPDGTPCVNGPHLVPAVDACEWQPCKDEPMPAVAYYVCDTGGDDARSATAAKNPSTPWKTSSKAVAQFGSLDAGEAIAFCRGGTFDGGGVYHNEHATQANPTIVRDYTRPGREGMGDARPIFTGYLESDVEVGHVKFLNLACHTASNRCIFTYDKLSGDVTFCNVELASADIGAEIANDSLPIVSAIKIQGARFIDNPNQGWLGTGQDLELSNSYFYNNGSGKNLLNHSIYLGTRAGTSNGFILRGNEFHPPAGTGGSVLEFHGSNANVLVEGNVVNFDLGQPLDSGYGIEQACAGYAPIPSNGDHFTIRGNTVVNAGNMSLGVGCCQHCVIENNLIINTQQLTWAIGAPQQEATGLTGYSPPLKVSTDVVVRNNTVYLTKGGIGVRAGTEGANYVVENNAVQSSGNCFQYGSGGFDSRDYNLSYGCSEAVTGAHSSKTSPKWKAPGTDFHPDTGSPLIGAGDPAQNPGTDIAGTTRPATPSIGAYEP